MAIIDKFLVGPASAPVHQVGTYLQSAENVLDFGADGFSVEAGDEVLIVKLPNQAVVTKVTMEVDVVEGQSAVITIGDFNTPAGWHLELETNQLGLTIGTGVYSPFEHEDAETQGNGVRYPGGLLPDTINLVATNALSNCKLWFSVEYYVREQFTNNV